MNIIWSLNKNEHCIVLFKQHFFFNSAIFHAGFKMIGTLTVITYLPVMCSKLLEDLEPLLHGHTLSKHFYIPIYSFTILYICACGHVCGHYLGEMSINGYILTSSVREA